MDNSVLVSLMQHYQWKLSLFAALGIAAVSFLADKLLLQVPTFRQAGELNESVFKQKMQREAYATNQHANRKWGVVFLGLIFTLILPFCLTARAQPWWRVALDIAAILMLYDFVYYLTHRFVFHDGGVLGGPLLWMHAVHHRQLDPCRWDSSYIHPLEIAIGLGLFVASILVLSCILGQFQVVTIVIAWFAFTWVNLQNHARWTADRFPFRYLNFISRMHHNHHATFTGGNFATLTVLYDWLFGTLDGAGRPRKSDLKAPAAPP